MKRCRSCKKPKDINEFYKTRTEKRDRIARCKSCIKAYDKKRYKEDSGPMKERSRRYVKTEKGKEVKRETTRRMYRKYPERFTARMKLNYAVKNGKIARLACEKCGNFLSEAHHPDYSKPLEVWWLCKKHHKQADKGSLFLYE